MATQRIQVRQSVSTGLRAGWERIGLLDVEIPAFNEGAFGELYECRAIDQQAPPVPLVIKIFKADGEGNDQRGYGTILKLQQRVRDKNQERLHTGKTLMAIPGLYALPQFSFEGQFQGRPVLGYAAHKLDPRRFSGLDDILQNRFREFRRLDDNRRHQLALELAECFGYLREMNYIHADINPQNLFVDLQDGHLVLIDYDSGVVVDRPEDAPTTFGKSNEWLAPEVYEQLSQASGGQPTVKVDLFTDTWSVAVGIHYLLFARFPYFFLKVLGPKEIRGYLARHTWPEVDPRDGNYHPGQSRVYEDFRHRFDASDPRLKRPFKVTFGEGALQPHRRVSYAQWVQLLKPRVTPIPFGPQVPGAASVPPPAATPPPPWPPPSPVASPQRSVPAATPVAPPVFRPPPVAPQPVPTPPPVAGPSHGQKTWVNVLIGVFLLIAYFAFVQRPNTPLPPKPPKPTAVAPAPSVAPQAQVQSLLDQARQALLQGDRARAEQALAQAAKADAKAVTAFRREQAARYLEIARRKQGENDPDAVEVALEQATQWDQAAVAEFRQGTSKAKSQSTRQPYEPELVLVPGGTFQMGSPTTEKDRVSDERPHQVRVKDFFIGKYEVTQAQWRAVMGNNPSYYKDCGDTCPVEQVSWNDIQDFLGKLNTKTGKGYRLPTEAEWEYACRSGGKAELYCGGADPDRLAWHAGNSGNKTHPVGRKAPNGLGLHDMSGNVWEWTCSAYVESYDGSESRCVGKNDANARRGGRGGSWFYVPAGVRSAIRLRDTPDFRGNSLGFRLAQD